MSINPLPVRHRRTNDGPVRHRRTQISVGTMVTMTSVEIANLLGVRHDSVRRTIERCSEKGAIELPPMVEKPTNGRSALVYIFVGEQGKRDSFVVVAQLSPEFTARLVDRWQQLEWQALQVQRAQQQQLTAYAAGVTVTDISPVRHERT